MFVLLQQVKWNHFIMTSVFTVFHVDLFTCVVSSRRNKTNPHHRNINSFLFFIQLMYKHASPNYQHMINSRKLINKMLVSLCVVCICWNIFNRIHFFASCDDVVFLLCNCFHVILLYMTSVRKSSKQLRQTSFLIIHNSFSHC